MENEKRTPFLDNFFVVENLTFLSLILTGISTNVLKSVVMSCISLGIVILTVFLFTYRLYQLLKDQDRSTKRNILKNIVRTKKSYIVLLVLCFIWLYLFWI